MVNAEPTHCQSLIYYQLWTGLAQFLALVHKTRKSHEESSVKGPEDFSAIPFQDPWLGTFARFALSFLSHVPVILSSPCWYLGLGLIEMIPKDLSPLRHQRALDGLGATSVRAPLAKIHAMAKIRLQWTCLWQVIVSILFSIIPI